LPASPPPLSWALSLVRPALRLPTPNRLDGQSKEHVGLMWDRDTVAFYGDPAWDARLAPAANGLEQKLSEKGGVLTFEARSGAAMRPGRPLAALLPYRVKQVKVLEGEALEPLITGNFIMLPKLKDLEAGKSYRVVFKGERL
jgi:zinc protease